MDTVSVIIPTTCETRRKELLARAIESILTQDDVAVQLIVVVNGARFDNEYLQQLQQDSRLTVAYLEAPSFPLAVRHGRQMVTSDYFCFLDDDDEYLPNALSTRLAPMRADTNVDLVATNGYRGASERAIVLSMDAINADPLAALGHQNWLASCGGLYRTSAITSDFFHELPKYLEWTTLAYQLLLAKKRSRFIDVPTYRINDTAESLSKSSGYRTASVYLIEKLLSLPLPSTAKIPLRRKLLAARHELSVENLQAGNKAMAWHFHLQSLRGLSGWRYLSYTRHLIFQSPKSLS